MDPNLEKLIEELKCQFLCCYPVRCINWQKIPTSITWEEQDKIVEETYKHPLNQVHPIKRSYQLQFLRRLMQQLETSYSQLHDSLYNSYCELQQTINADMVEQYCYKHYLLRDQNKQLSLRESKSFVVDGTTGMCTWQASLSLADFLMENKDLLKGKDVLEIGAGTGICGMILLLDGSPRQVLLTDGSIKCVNLMQENIERNFSHAEKVSPQSYKVNNTTLSVAELQWGNISEVDLPIDFCPDILLAADVVYDDSVFTDLVQTIDSVFRWKKNKCMMLLAATVRNEYTLKKFRNMLDALHFLINEKDVIPEERSRLFWDRTVPVKIFRITKNNKSQ